MAGKILPDRTEKTKMEFLHCKRIALAVFLLPGVGAFAQTSLPVGVIAAGGSTLGSYLVNAATGALSQAEVFDGPFSAVAASPSGGFVYAAAGMTLFGATFDSGTGAVTPIPGFPYSLPGAITALTVEASGRFLYLGSTGSLYGAGIDPATGALTLVAGSPFPRPYLPAPYQALVSDGAGKYLYASQDYILTVLSIDATTGALTPTAGGFGDTGGLAMAVDPRNRFLFASNSNGLAGYAINGSTGGLTALRTGGPPEFFPGTASAGVSFDGTGNFLYAAQSGSSPGLLWGFAVDPASGNLTSVPGSPFLCGADCYAVAGDASGQYLYATDDNGVLAYAIDAASGTLTYINGIYAGGTSVAGETSIALVPAAS
jgi:6-phosphogluconolactonase (cycloisomerase 2 family)